MRSLILAALLALAVAPPAHAQATGTTGVTGPTGPTPAAVATDPATELTQTTATLHGRVTPNGGETTVRFEYGTSTSYGVTTATQTLPAGTAAVAVAARLERLTSATTYHVRLVATNAAGVSRSSDRTFRTISPPSRPAVASEPAVATALDAATLSARVDPNRQATSYAFEYGTSSRYGSRTPAADAGAGDAGVRVQARIGGLAPDTSYHFRLRATNATGTTLGRDRTFRTAAVPLGVTARAVPSPVRYGTTLTVTGTVSGSDHAGVAVALERRSFPFGTGFSAVGGLQLTNAAGVVAFLVPPFTLSSQFRLSLPTRGGVTSNVASVPVRAALTLRARRLRGGRLQLRGTVAPAGARGLVSLQRRGADGRYRTVKRAALRRAGGSGVRRYAVVVRARSALTRYRTVTRLRGGALRDAHSAIVRVHGRTGK